jgi:hypothetical protein
MSLQSNQTNSLFTLSSEDEKRLLELWEQWTNSGGYTLGNSIKYVQEWFKRKYPTNLTIIDITQELINEKVEFTTSERSVKQWLNETYPLTVQLKESTTKLSQQVVDILQYIDTCRTESEEEEVLWLGITNIIERCHIILQKEMEAYTKKRVRAEEEREKGDTNQGQDISIIILPPAKLPDYMAKTISKNDSKRTDPSENTVFLAAKLIASYNQDNIVTITDNTEKLVSACMNGVEIVESKVLAKAVDKAFQKTALAEGQVILGRPNASLSNNVISGTLADTGKLRSPMQMDEMHKEYATVYQGIISNTINKVESFQKRVDEDEGRTNISFTSNNQNYIDAKAKATVQANIFVAVMKALRQLKDLAAVERNGLQLTLNELGKLTKVLNHWINVKSAEYHEMDRMAPVTPFGFLINSITPGQNCASNLLADCFEELRDEDKPSFFTDVIAEQIEAERYSPTKNLPDYINEAYLGGIKRSAMAIGGVTGISLKSMGLEVNKEGSLTFLSPAKITQRILHQLYTHAAKLKDNSIIRDRLKKDKFQELMGLDDATISFTSLMKEIYSEMDINVSPKKEGRENKRVKVAEKEDLEPTSNIEQQANGANIRDNTNNKVSLRDSPVYKSEMNSLQKQVKSRSSTIKQFVQEASKFINEGAGTTIIPVNASGDVIYPLDLRNKNIPKSVTQSEFKDKLIRKLVLVKDIMKGHRRYNTDKTLAELIDFAAGENLIRETSNHNSN